MVSMFVYLFRIIWILSLLITIRSISIHSYNLEDSIEVNDESADGLLITSALMTQSAALSYCRGMVGQRLIEIQGSDENEKVFKFISATNSDDEWMWTSGTPYDWNSTTYTWMSTNEIALYTSFYPENPEYNLTLEEWARMGIALQKSTYSWVIKDHANRFPAICERRT